MTNQLEEKYQESIYGKLEGFDRLIFKGHLTSFFHNGFYYFLSKENVLLKDYGQYVKQITTKLKEHINQIVTSAGCYYEYLNKPGINKEEIAKREMQDKQVKEGLICVLSDVEPCWSFNLVFNRNSGKLEIHHDYRKCQHYYFYYNDRDFGLMHVRMMSWYPFEIQIYINGREYLKKQLDKENIKYESYDNSLTYIENLVRAQELMNKLQEKKLQRIFDGLAYRINPQLEKIVKIMGMGYHWCVHQCEYATDIMFKTREKLVDIYPYLLEHASLCLMGEDIFTFFGRKITGNTQGEAVSDKKGYVQGVRIKYRLDKNSIKMYDKWSILRIETTINNPGAFKIYNTVTRKGRQIQAWVPMGKSVSNLYRYAEVSKSCNNRYMNQLSYANDTLKHLNFEKGIENLSSSVITKLSEKSGSERAYGKFNLLASSTCKIFNAVLDGAFTIAGFANNDLKQSLIKLQYFTKNELQNTKKLTGKVTRIITKLRAHKLIYKVAKSFCYLVTKKGMEIMADILSIKKIYLRTVPKVC
jgi:hypothetical protein